MLQIGICDDAGELRLQLQAQLERLLEASATEHRFFTFSSGEGLLSWLDKHAGELDLVFLDIEMGGINGMETAKRLRASDASLQIVFVTGFADYVFDGYGVGALGYLLKPPSAQKLAEVLARAHSSLQTREPELFFCRAGDANYRIDKSTILYFSSERRQVICVTPARSYTFYGKLDEVEAELSEGFVRIHQRYLVRAGAVERMSTGEVELAGQTLPISRAYLQSALLALTRVELG